MFLFLVFLFSASIGSFLVSSVLIVQVIAIFRFRVTCSASGAAQLCRQLFYMDDLESLRAACSFFFSPASNIALSPLLLHC